MNENTNSEQFEKLERNPEKAGAYMQTISDFFHWSAHCLKNHESINSRSHFRLGQYYLKF
jgi:hypothetical protein